MPWGSGFVQHVKRPGITIRDLEPPPFLSKVLRVIHEKEAGGLNEAEVKRRHILAKAVAVGVVAGLIASAFRLSLQNAEHFRETLIGHFPKWQALLVSLAIGITAGGLGLWIVRKWAPEAAGSGIPHLKAVLMGEADLHWRRLLPVKFLAGVIGIGGGLALGREGPTVQMGGAAGLMTARFLRIRRGFGEAKALISAGAGAGLAAAFNAPLAGVIFVLEELQGNFTPVVFVAAFLASVCGDIVSRLLAGEAPVFHLHEVPLMQLQELPFALILGGLAGLAGIVFNRGLLGSLNAFEKASRSKWLPGAFAGALAGLAGWMIPGLAGGGGGLVDGAIAGNFAIGILPVLLVSRFILTMTSYGCGAAGGIFAPMLVIGALGGLLFGQSMGVLSPAMIAHPETYAILGMGALFTAIVRAPLTGIVLMVEMTGQYEFMLPLLVCCLSAYGVAELLKEPGIYEALKRRRSPAA